MVLEFLNKYQEELMTQKMELNEDYELLLSKIKENEKFLQLLIDENKSFFTDFSPREMQYKNKDRVEEVEKLLDNLKNNKSDLENKLFEIDNRIHEVNLVIDSTKENVQEEPQGDIKSKLKNITSYILSDPNRAKIELDNLISKL